MTPKPLPPKPKTGPAVVLTGALAIAAALIVKWEGVRYEVYRDPIGILTVCYGHTGPELKLGQKYTIEQCRTMLAADMAEAEAAVKRCIPGPKTAYQEGALISGTFNAGPKLVCGSTLQRKANAGDWAGACAEFDRWKKAGGRVLRGLLLRRFDERGVCEGRIPLPTEWRTGG